MTTPTMIRHLANASHNLTQESENEENSTLIVSMINRGLVPLEPGNMYVDNTAGVMPHAVVTI